MATNKINVTELGFDEIKSNLKSYLKSQDALKDYDFEGSALSVLLDVLAYNTHYNALYTNLAVNESFLDSASKRSSVVSRAKEIGYIPHSATSAKAIVNLVVTPSTSSTVSNTLTLPAYQSFTASIDGNDFTFYNLEAVTALLDTVTNTYTFENLDIYEGNVLTFKYEVADGVQYIIPNTDVDLATLKVRVAENATTTSRRTYIRQENILNLDGNSEVYFVKEIEGKLYELEFGNGTIGKALQDGNIVELTYLVTNKDAANGISSFIYSGATLVTGSTFVTTLSKAQAGSDIEDIDSIRYNAPRAYAAQNRTVTVDDYKSFIYKTFKDADSVNVWGGEANIPPQYGRVFISIKPKNTDILTVAQKNQILTALKDKNVVSITPIIVDPDYIKVMVDTTVYYNPRLTSLTANEIKTLVINTIKDYNDKNLDSFTGVLKYSNLVSVIDQSENSILSNITNLMLHRSVEVQYGTQATYVVYLNNPIYGSGVPEQSMLSSGFYVYGRTEVMYLEDLPTGQTTGTIRMFYFDESNNKVYVRTFGTIDYANGVVTIPDLYITGLDTSVVPEFELMFKPQSNDVVSIRNQLVTIPDDTISVKVIVDTVAMGDSAGGSNYKFTSSRT